MGVLPNIDLANAYIAIAEGGSGGLLNSAEASEK
jgi:hypothetical protein